MGTVLPPEFRRQTLRLDVYYHSKNKNELSLFPLSLNKKIEFYSVQDDYLIICLLYRILLLPK
jgi:hypothetical protein